MYINGDVFPNDVSDVKPLPQTAWLNDFSLCSGILNIENVCGDVPGNHWSVVWMLNARQCWCDFIGIEETKGRARPFIEPFPLRLCMCYPIARIMERPTQLSLQDVNTLSEHSQESSMNALRRSPSDPYCKQAKSYRKSSSTRSTPLSSPGFAKVHKSPSATSVNIPLLPLDLRDKTIMGISSNISKSGSEESTSSFTEDSITSGSTASISSNSFRSNLNGKINTESGSSIKLRENIAMLTGDSRGGSASRTNPFVSSTSEIEFDASGDSRLDKNSPRSKLAENGQQDDPECTLSILLHIPDALAITLDHYQFVFLMRLQESFVTLRNVLFADLEKFDGQRRKLQEKTTDACAPVDPGILFSLVSKGAEVVLLVPAPNVEQSQCESENCTESHDVDPSDNGYEQSESIEADIKLQDYEISPRDNEKLLEADDSNEHLVKTEDGTVDVRPSSVVHEQNESENSSANASTFGTDYSLLTAGTNSERSSACRDVSTITITATSLECSVAIKSDDFAFRLLTNGCDINESYHESLVGYLNSKLKCPKSHRMPSKGYGELRLRYAMGSTVDKEMTGAVENGVAHLMLSDFVVPLLMSNVDGLLECVQDEVEVPQPFMPAIIDLKNIRFDITSDTPPRLLSLPQPLPLNVHIDQGTIMRTGEGEIQMNVPWGPVASATRQNLYRTHEGQLVTSDKMIERLREESNEMTSRVSAIRCENVRLLSELQVSNELKECLKNERDKLLETVERLTDELVKSNREYDRMQDIVRHLQNSGQS